MKQKSWELKDRVRAEIYLKTHEDMPKRKKKTDLFSQLFFRLVFALFLFTDFLMESISPVPVGIALVGRGVC